MDRVKRVIALGFFDGVHIGHAALLRQTAVRAAELGAKPAAVTFDVPPEAKITGRALPLVCSVGERIGLMKTRFGLEDVIVLPFTDALMTLPWDKFVPDLLVKDYGAAGVVAGHDFTFGYLGEGTAHKLARQCADLGLTCDIIPSVELDGVVVSSTVIRMLIAQGAMERAARFLGRPYGFTLPVRHGRGRGRRLGFPTVNMAFPGDLQPPAAGVYRSQVTVDGTVWPAVTNLGKRPTFGDDGELVAETHLYDFRGDLYGLTLRAELLAFLRPEKKFASAEDLKRQVLSDLEQGRAAAEPR